MGIEIYLLYIGWRVRVESGEYRRNGWWYGSGDGWCHLTVVSFGVSFRWNWDNKNKMKGNRTRMGI
jgi:hypothetical protein